MKSRTAAPRLLLTIGLMTATLAGCGGGAPPTPPPAAVTPAPPVTPVAHTVGNPRTVRFAQQIQIRPSARRRFLDPCRTTAEIVTAIDDRAQQVGVLDQ